MAIQDTIHVTDKGVCKELETFRVSSLISYLYQCECPANLRYRFGIDHTS